MKKQTSTMMIIATMLLFGTSLLAQGVSANTKDASTSTFKETAERLGTASQHLTEAAQQLEMASKKLLGATGKKGNPPIFSKDPGAAHKFQAQQDPNLESHKNDVALQNDESPTSFGGTLLDSTATVAEGTGPLMKRDGGGSARSSGPGSQ